MHGYKIHFWCPVKTIGLSLDNLCDFRLSITSLCLILIRKKVGGGISMVAHTCNVSTWKGEAGEVLLQTQLGEKLGNSATQSQN